MRAHTHTQTHTCTHTHSGKLFQQTLSRQKKMFCEIYFADNNKRKYEQEKKKSVSLLLNSLALAGNKMT